MLLFLEIKVIGPGLRFILHIAYALPSSLLHNQECKAMVSGRPNASEQWHLLRDC